MSVGLRLPVGASPTGGFSLVEKDEQASKIIGLGLQSSDSENAFQQDISLEDDMIFDVQSGELQAKILRRVVAIFRAFEQENLFKLVAESVNFEVDSAQQNLTMELHYINLESDEEEIFRRVFSAEGR